MAHEQQNIDRHTPLYSLHHQLGGKLVSFADYQLPVQYSKGILAEHRHTRAHASLFDVSHMGQATLHATAHALEKIFPSDLRTQAIGQQRYSFLLNEAGGILDDLMIIRRGESLWHIIVNAACKEKDYAAIAGLLSADARLERCEDLALLALQGPAASEVIGALNASLSTLPFMAATEAELAGIKVLISRSGYTGEDGYEISVGADHAEALASRLLADDRVEPAGLGARDTLRLEAGLCLYGQDIDETTSPIEAGLGWAIAKRRKQEGGFIGAARVQRELQQGTSRKRIGLVVQEKRPVRAPSVLLDKSGAEVGHITSGAVAASFAAPIAMGYIKTALAKVGSEIIAVQRGKEIATKITKMPFRQHNYFVPSSGRQQEKL